MADKCEQPDDEAVDTGHNERDDGADQKDEEDAEQFFSGVRQRGLEQKFAHQRETHRVDTLGRRVLPAARRTERTEH